MKLDPIVISLLDTDLYKFTMAQVIFHNYAGMIGEYRFKCRNENVFFTREMLREIDEQIDYLCGLRFRRDELEYLRSLRFIKDDYVDFLRHWYPVREYVTTSLDAEGHLNITVRGSLLSSMQFEIYLLEIVNEVYFRIRYDYEQLRESAVRKLDRKIAAMNSGKYNFRFAEFGCRRRLSREWQDTVIRRFTSETVNCSGISSVYYAKKYNLTPVGTYAHEFVQMYQGIDTISPAYTNHYAMKDWYREYSGDNGTALSDTLTTDLFLEDFTHPMIENYAGVRHDSGDPYVWGEKIIAHFKKYGIDPLTKQLIFSDSLDFDKAEALYQFFKDRAKVAFGIGTFCSNDTDVPPLNIVIKLQYVNGRPVAKLSDTPSKAMCSDPDYLKELKRSIALRLSQKAVK